MIKEKKIPEFMWKEEDNKWLIFAKFGGGKLE